MEDSLTSPRPEADSAGPLLLEARRIVKRYPGVTALDRVDFDLRAGEVHALLGENGAGKTTLIRVLTGATIADAGSVMIEGRRVRPHSPAEAQRLGIAAVQQEIDLIPQLSIAENLMLGKQPTRWGFIRWRELRKRARLALVRVGVDVDVRAPVHSLSLATQQMVAIARALDQAARILVLDEPTSSLDAAEALRLFSLLRDLKARGLGIIFITHFIDQVFANSDRITVLRNGINAGCFATSRVSRVELISTMLGRPIGERPRVEVLQPVAPPEEVGAPPVIEVEQLSRRGSVAPFDLSISRGEVVGLAGLLGSGRTEAARLMFGADRAHSGRIRVGGRLIRWPSPRNSLRAGVGMVPEDRKRQAIIPDLSLGENLVVAVQSQRGLWRRIGRAERRQLVERFKASLNISAPASTTAVRLLSGGNQQKVVLARWLATHPRFMILDEPTRGIDIGAKAEVEQLIATLRRRGLSMLFISSELEEIVRDTTRIVILRDRRIIGAMKSRDATARDIIDTIAGARTP